MPKTTDVAKSLRDAASRLQQMFTSNGWNRTMPFVQLFGGYSPSMSADTLLAYFERIASRVEKLNKEELERDGCGTFLTDVIPQIDMLQFNSINQPQFMQAVNTIALLQMIEGVVPARPLLPPPPKVDWEDLKGNKELLPKDLARRLRFVATRLAELEPRSAEIDQKISEIEDAHTAAEQLPTDLAELSAQRSNIAELAESAAHLVAGIEAANTRSQDTASAIRDSAEASGRRITENDEAVRNLIERSEQALRGATSVGLSRAFEKRKSALSTAAFLWTIGLIGALIGALMIGAERVEVLRDVLISDRSATVIWVNALLAILGLGAPIWFAWLSTKQIGTNLRLAEDYAFKASVSQAYEGYRSEAVQIDPDLQRRLFASALTRIEEAPIRLLETEPHGTPLQELLANPTIRKALEGVPNVAAKILELIPVKQRGAAAVLAPIAAAGLAIEPEKPNSANQAEQDV